MIGPLLYQDIVEEVKREVMQEVVLDILEDQFGPEAKDIEARPKTIAFDRQREFIRLALKCRSLASFRKRLLAS